MYLYANASQTPAVAL